MLFVPVYISYSAITRIMYMYIFYDSTSPVCQGLLIVEVSRLPSHMPHSVGLLWTSDQPLTETFTWKQTQFSQQTVIHAPGGIRTRIPNEWDT